MAPLKILVADEHHLIREGLKLALRDLDAGATILEAETMDRALELWESEGADLVLMELSLPGASGPSAPSAFLARWPQAPVVVVSAQCDIPTVRAAVAAGARGFIPKATSRKAMLSALRFMLDGNLYVPPEALTTPAPTSLAPAAGEPPAQPDGQLGPLPSGLSLTARQREVLDELLQGKSNRQICDDLHLALGTVKGHMAAIFAALRVNTRTEAIAVAQKLGIRPANEH